MILLGMILGVIVSLMIFAGYVLLVSFTIWMMIDAGKQDRFWWLLCIIGVPLIGALVYYFTEKKHEYAKVTPHRVHESETEVQHERAPKKKVVRKSVAQKSEQTTE